MSVIPALRTQKQEANWKCVRLCLKKKKSKNQTKIKWKSQLISHKMKWLDAKSTKITVRKREGEREERTVMSVETMKAPERYVPPLSTHTKKQSHGNKGTCVRLSCYDKLPETTSPAEGRLIWAHALCFRRCHVIVG